MKYEHSTVAANLVLASTAVLVGAHIIAWNRKERARQELVLPPLDTPSQQQSDKASSGGPWCGSGMPFSLRAPWESCDEALNVLANIGLEPGYLTGLNVALDESALSDAVMSFQTRYNFWKGATLLIEDGKLGNNTGTALAEVASAFGIPVDVRSSPSSEISDWWKGGDPDVPGGGTTGGGGTVTPGDPVIIGETVPRAVGLEVESDSDYNLLDNATHAHIGLRRGAQELLDYINYILERRPTGYSIEYRQIPIELAIQTSAGGKPQDHIHPQVVTQIGAERLADGETIEMQSEWGEELGSDDKEWHKHQFTIRAVIEQVEI